MAFFKRAGSETGAPFHLSKMICFSFTSRTTPLIGACKIAPSAFGAGSPMICPALTRSPTFTLEMHGVPALCLSGRMSRLE